ncbi:MAG: hypothetical protein R6V85_02015 [Polyangia bacterium]
MTMILWSSRDLDSEPDLDDNGFFEVDGVRYGSFAACGKALGTSAKKAQQAWRESVPQAGDDGFFYATGEEQKLFYYTWKEGRKTLGSYYPLEVISDLLGLRA